MKHPLRKNRIIRLVESEGPDDRRFFEHLRRCYINRNILKVDIRSANGGDVETVINQAVRLKNARDYTQVFCALDTDRDEWLNKASQSNLRKKAEQSGVELIELEPLCLEGFLLTILGIKTGGTARSCKSKLYKYHGIPDKDISKLLSKEFNKKLLDKRRVQLKLLDRIIRIFET